MMTHPLLIAGKLPMKTLVAKQLSTKIHTHPKYLLIYVCNNLNKINGVIIIELHNNVLFIANLD